MPTTFPNRIIVPIQRKQISSDGWMLNLLSKNVATITTPQGLRQTAYFSFEDMQTASEFLEKSTHNGDVEKGIIRKGKYLCGHEVKTWGADKKFILNKALVDIDAGNHLFQKKLGILQEHIIMTYLFDFNGKPYRYKQVSEQELETLCSHLKQADWSVEDGTKIAQFFNRIVSKNK
ncbi:MAG: hypothetical protein AAFV71_32320 [Cyanobacteria bacterium J06633_8]